MDISYETLRDGDYDSLLTLWNRNLGTIFPIEARLLQQNLMNKDHVSYGDVIGAYAVETDVLVGAVAFVQHILPMGLSPASPQIGTIRFILVDYRFRGQQIGTNLLEMAEARLAEAQVKEIRVGGEFRHFFPGLPSLLSGARCLFKEHGYKESGSAYDLIGDIDQVDLQQVMRKKNKPLQQESYPVLLLQQAELSRTEDFFIRNFPGRWYEEFREFKSLQDYDHMLIMKDQGTGKVIGFCRIHDSNSKELGSSIYWHGLLENDYGGLGPIGLDLDYRDQGLGIYLLYRSLEILQKRQVHRCVIDWTILLKFYGAFNFVPWKEYVTLSKLLS